MDPLTAAGAFATLIGLVCNFKAERSSGSLDAFIVWLQEKHHDDVAAAIQRDANLVESLRALFATNHAELMDRIGRLDEAMSAVAAHVGTFSSVARSLRPNLALSDQAVSILRQLVEAQAKEIWEMKKFTGEPDEYLLMGGIGNGPLKYDEPLFIDDDFQTLCALGLLQPKVSLKGDRFFGVTRAAVAFVAAQRP